MVRDPDGEFDSEIHTTRDEDDKVVRLFVRFCNEAHAGVIDLERQSEGQGVVTWCATVTMPDALMDRVCKHLESLGEDADEPTIIL